MNLVQNPIATASTNETAIQKLSDECLELQIQTAGKRMEIANLMMQEPDSDFFGLAGERGFWRMQMEALIAKRSPGRVAQMEIERGIS